MSASFGLLNIKKFILTGTVLSSIAVAAVTLSKTEWYLNGQNSNYPSHTKQTELNNIFNDNEIETNYINLEQYKFLLENKNNQEKSEWVNSSKLKYSDLSPTILQSLLAPKITINKCDSEDSLSFSLCQNSSFKKPGVTTMSEKYIHENYTSIFNALSKKTQSEKISTIYSALIYGLLEWGKTYNFVVKSDININLVVGEIKHEFHNNGIYFQNFEFEFTVENHSNKKTWLFNKFELEPGSKQKINITLNKGIIKSSPRKLNHGMNTTVSWSFLPAEGRNFVVNIQKIAKNLNENNILNIENHETNEIKFIYTNIPNIEVPKYDDESSSDVYDRKFTNSITFQDLKKIIDPKLKHLTSDDVKKDLEHWYGSYTMTTIQLKLNDIISIIKYVNQDFFVDETGKPENIIEKFTKDHNSINWIFNFFNLSDLQRQLINNLINQLNGNNNEELRKKTLKSFFAFLDSAMHQIQHILKNLEQTFEWIENPVVHGPSFLSVSGYPTVSFKFKQTWKIVAKSQINLKGTWNSKTKTISAYKENITNDDEISFDILDMFLNPDKAFKGILDIVYDNNFFTQLIPGLLRNMHEFINWEKLTFNTTDYIVNTYSAHNSPISMAAKPSEDLSQNVNSNIIGYKILDIVWSYDIRNFWTIFAQLFNKIQCYKQKGSDGWSLNFWDLQNMQNSVVKPIIENPIKEIVHIVNSIIGMGYGNDKNSEHLFGCENSSTSSSQDWQDVKEEHAKNHPWNAFFQKIFRRAFTINSKQLFVGYPRILYSYHENFDEKLTELLTEKTKILNISIQKMNNQLAQKNNKYFIFEIEELNKKLNLLGSKYPITYKDFEVKEMSENIWFNFGFSFPNRPVIIPQNINTMLFLGDALNEEDKFSTTEKFIENKEFLPEFLISFFQDKTTRYLGEDWIKENQFFQDINPKKVKISSISLEIGEAFKQMLSTNLNYNKLPSLITTFINIPNMLNDAVEREFYLYHINLFREDGIWTNLNFENVNFLYYDSISDFYITSPWKFSMCKMNLGILKKQILPNCP